MTLYYQDEQVTVHEGDALDVLKTLADNSVDAVVTDPPYGLEFMGKDWDAPWQTGSGIGGNNAGFGEFALADGRTRQSRPSYMGGTNPGCLNCGGKKHGRDPAQRKVCTCENPNYQNVTLPRMVAFQSWCEQWATECLRVLKPGGHMLAFGGTRTWHRLACAIEDAGFEIRDSIAWLYGSGFPKSLDVSKAIDKRGGSSHLAPVIADAIKSAREARGWSATQADQYFCNGTTNWTWYEGRKGVCRPPTPEDFARIASEWPELSSVATLVAEADREVVGLSARHGGGVVGAGSSYELPPDVPMVTAPATDAAKQWQGWGTALKPAFEPIVVARKPLQGTVAANVLAHGTGALNIDATRVGYADDADFEKHRRTAEQTAQTGGVGKQSWKNSSDLSGVNPAHTAGRWPPNVVLDGEMADELDRQSGITKSSSSPSGTDRSVHAIGATGLAKKLDRGLHDDSGGASRFFPTFRGRHSFVTLGDRCASPWLCASCGQVESAEIHQTPTFRYTAKAPGTERPTADGIAHPTVKPLDLMRWLVRLVTPPNGVVLDPFAGSGTTGEAAIHEHKRAILIEREPSYLPLIVARLSKPMAVGFDFGEGA